MNILPNLKHLQYLIALHQQQNFHRAADVSFVSQSTLSSAIIKLEEQLGCQLLERDNKSFVFTSVGNLVVEKAEELLMQSNELVSFAKQQGDINTGQVRLGCIPTIAPFLLADMVHACKQSLPNVELFLREDTSDNLIAMLHSGELDAVVLALPFDVSGFRSVSVGRDNFYYLSSSVLIDEVNRTGGYETLPDSSVFLLSEEHCLTGHTISACHLASPNKINSFHATSLTTLVQMAEHHKGLTFLPKIAVDKGIHANTSLVVSPVPGKPYREIGVAWRKTSMRQQTYQNIADILKTILAS